MNISPGLLEWSKVRTLIFDVDGTLYNQKFLRGKMMKALLGYYLLRPWKYQELKIISVFRKERETLHSLQISNLEEAQYEICAKKVNQPLALVKQVIQRWIFTEPLQYLEESTYSHVHAFFDLLKQRNIQIAIYSDYKAAEKLQAMRLPADLIVCSTDPEIDRMKPDPKGLMYITRQLKVEVADCVFIGDRDELDGACARAANMPYIILEKDAKGETSLYRQLCEEIQNTL